MQYACENCILQIFVRREHTVMHDISCILLTYVVILFLSHIEIFAYIAIT